MWEEGKAFKITQKEVLVAYKAVKANKGAGGVDGIELETFEKDWKNRLYKLWNRMTSGSYFPQPVRGVEIPKKNGKKRLLGIPTIEDRVAQTVLKNRLEPKAEPYFLESSFGYRPHKSALDAVGQARQNCFRYHWGVEFDIVGLFDNIDHELLMKMVKAHTDEKWMILYIDRSLKAPIKMPDGEVKERTSGTPQGGVIGPVLANLVMHYTFDQWLTIRYPGCPWERYADDGIIHCKTRNQAIYLLDKLKKRMKEFGLEIHPEKSKIVHCVRNNEKPLCENISFEFLGYCFRPRLVKSREGIFFRSFTPAVSNAGGKAFRDKIRKAIREANTTSIQRLSVKLNPIIRGWMNYFTKYTSREAFKQGINYVNRALVCWLEHSRKKVKGSARKAKRLLSQIAGRNPEMFYHWQVGYMPKKLITRAV